MPPNQITADGLEVSSRSELTTYFTEQFQEIYGEDIILESDTPDGQLIGILVQAILDLEDLLVQIYNGFDPDEAVGVVLDQRVAINGIQRQAGTFTITNIQITTDRALTLQGLDAAADDADGEGYTVSDVTGNQWILLETQNPPAADVYTYAFRAKNPGAVATSPNTITVPVTIVLGVTLVNNPTTYTTLGLNEETDAELRIRRQQSVSLSSQGYLEGLLAALLNISDVEDAFIYENTTDDEDADLIPGHSIWVIVSGGAASADIANAIYRKRNAGCGMKGDVTYNVLQADGTYFTVKWDVVEAEDLYIQFDATSLDGSTPIDTDLLKSGLVERLTPGVNAQVNINELSTIVQEIDPNCLVTNAGFSTDGMSYSDYLSPTEKKNQFALAVERIDITVV